MKIKKATFEGGPIALYCPETYREFEKGESLQPLQPGDGLWFDAHEYLKLYRIKNGEMGQLPPAEQPVSLPIAVGFNSDPLDVCWIDQDGMVVAVAHNHRGVLQSACHFVLEVAAGEANRLGIDIGKRISLNGDIRGGN